jgi:signal transduction histidine kinase
MGNFWSEVTEQLENGNNYDKYNSMQYPNIYGSGQTDQMDLAEYTSITATVFVIVMIILLLVLLVCCCKTVLVCRKQKRVNDQRRRMMTREQENSHNSTNTQNTILRAYTLDGQHHTVELPGGGYPINVMYQEQLQK